MIEIKICYYGYSYTLLETKNIFGPFFGTNTQCAARKLDISKILFFSPHGNKDY